MRHPQVLCLAGLLLASHASPGYAQTTAEPPAAALPVTGVTLYTSGVGYFERGGVVDGDATQTLLFPVGQMNDVLKSLVLLDNGGGTIRPVTYGAQDPVTKQLQAFSVDVSDNPDQATLLNRMRGASVTITYNDTSLAKTITGTIVGVQTQTISLPNNGGTTQQSSLTLLADGALHTLPLAAITDTQINDPELRRELGSALAVVAQSRDASKRPVTLNFAGKGRRNVLVGYLTEAPLWQSSYRLVLGKSPILQGWAMVQNTSQDDWNNVHLTLVSGRPISFIQDLYTPLYIPRPFVQASVQGSPTPQTYQGNLDTVISNGGLNGAFSPSPATLPSSSAQTYDATGAPPTIFARGAGSGVPAHADMPAFQLGNFVSGGAGRSQFSIRSTFGEAVSANGAQLGTALFTYKIAAPLSIGRQKAAMIPFVSSSVQAQTVSIYNPDVQPGHPLLGARLKNSSGLHLMGGPLTVFDDSAAGGTAYVGDALIDDTEPGQTRLISYAIDLGVDGQSEFLPEKSTTVTVKLYKGNLIIKTRREQAQVYTIKNNSDKPRLVVIEHPYNGADWTLLEPAKVTERTADLLRFDLPVAAHESKKLTVREAYPNADYYGLMSSDFDTLLITVKNGQASAAVSAAIQDIIDRRSKVTDIQSKINAIDSDTQSISQGQQRIRNNMHELDRTSTLYRRYASELDAQETRLNDLQTRKTSLQSDLTLAQNALNNYIANVNL